MLLPIALAALIALQKNTATGVDLRNVRMRFLFFETFKYPTAELTAKVDPAVFADLIFRFYGVRRLNERSNWDVFIAKKHR
ncbi:hypothetical protein NKI38_07060 [Mesorhizobium sp. M0621]|uniref:hypothetical protein n=1 Tax=Mesorhizobium sp. M0621 TaxID=2956974 RepID=UPI00333B99AE